MPVEEAEARRALLRDEEVDEIGYPLLNAESRVRVAQLGMYPAECHQDERATTTGMVGGAAEYGLIQCGLAAPKDFVTALLVVGMNGPMAALPFVALMVFFAFGKVSTIGLVLGSVSIPDWPCGRSA